MTWISISLIIFLLTFIMLRKTIIQEWDSFDLVNECRLTIKDTIIIFILCIIPVVNIILFIIFLFFYIICFDRKPKRGKFDRIIIVYNDKKLSHRIIKKVISILNSEV